MRWPAAMVFAAACAAGCHSAPPALDPFLPRTRIPPPGTGAATGSPDAYPYTGSAPAYSPPTNVPGGAGSNGLFAPPGGYPFQPSSPAPATGGYAPIPGPVNRSQSQAAPSQAAQVVRASHVTTADDEPSPVYEGGRRAKSADISQPDDATTQTVDLMDLPPVTRLRR